MNKNDGHLPSPFDQVDSSRTSGAHGIGFRDGMSHALDICLRRITTARSFGQNTEQLEILRNLLIRKLDTIVAPTVTPENR